MTTLLESKIIVVAESVFFSHVNAVFHNAKR